MKLSVLPTVNDLVLAMDRYDQAITDVKAGKFEVNAGKQVLAGPALEACKSALLADLTMRRATLMRDLEACGVEFD